VATGRASNVRAFATNVLGRISRIRAFASTSVHAITRISNIRFLAAAPSVPTIVEPFTAVDLGMGSWVQTSGPAVTVPQFTAPALPAGAVLHFNASGSATTVLPHTFFALGTGGALSALNRNGATTTGTTPAPGTYSDTYTTGY
jgi:hypothetical protein